MFLYRYLLRLGNRNVNDIMAPRPDIISIDVDDSWEEISKKIKTCGYSQFPVYRQDPDNILCIVSIKDIWRQSSDVQVKGIQGIIQQPLFAPESLKALKILELFKQSRTHVTLIVDEYGAIQGYSYSP
ncbi:MAG TPA: CBS domain-containing protein [Syntrophorhabdus sp.]|nr:CBS domain-containing protein [Syntrophorhabdus sp.]